MSADIREFSEVWTHDAALALITDTIRRFGEHLGAKIVSHKYESTSPDGVVIVEVEKTGGNQSIRYGLPDDRKSLKQMAIAALEPVERWKSQHRREW